MRKLLALAGALWLALAIFALPTVAQAKTGVFVGRVQHVSTQNIKVAGITGSRETLSFLLVPRFKNLFSADGKTTYQMAHLRDGMLVKVFYDQKLLGSRHADKIFIMNERRHGMAGMKS